MRIPTLGQLTIDAIQFVGLFAEKAEDMQPNAFTDKTTGVTTTKQAPNGRVLHRTSVKALRIGEDGTPSGEEQNVSLNLIEPIDVVAGVPYGLWDSAWFTPWQNDSGRGAMSIAGTTLKPVAEIRKLLADGAKQHDGPMKMNLPKNDA